MAGGYTLFPTAIGTCAIAWGDDSVVATSLPDQTEARLHARMRARAPGAESGPPPDFVVRAIDGIVTLADKGRADLADIALDMARVPELDRKIYAIARRIPAGETTTYGAIAKELGDPLLAQTIGRAMGQNPFPIIVPCHRVLAAGGKMGGFSAHGGVETKRRLLTIEGGLAEPELALFG